ncbi:apical endosomal glycoprotein [Rhinophrynus dorsalis]
MYSVHPLLLLLCLYYSAVGQCYPQILCNFICDYWDCSDEILCGYHQFSPGLGAPFSCDFEQDNCGWKDISTSSYQWVRERRSFPRWGSRHHGDHTLENKWGWFVATGGHVGKSAVTASLKSPVLRDAAATCEIHIHYHMWVPDSPTLNGSLSVQLTDNKQTYNLWVSSRSSVLAWRQAVIYTGRIPGEFQLTLSFSREAFSHGDIAIDDLEFRHCALSVPKTQCPAGHHQCARGSCVEPDALCDGTDDCGDNSDEANCAGFRFCNFDTDSCGWNASSGPGWDRTNGVTSNPGRDHTTNSRSELLQFHLNILLNMYIQTYKCPLSSSRISSPGYTDRERRTDLHLPRLYGQGKTDRPAPTQVIRTGKDGQTCTHPGYTDRERWTDLHPPRLYGQGKMDRPAPTQVIRTGKDGQTCTHPGYTDRERWTDLHPPRLYGQGKMDRPAPTQVIRTGKDGQTCTHPGYYLRAGSGSPSNATFTIHIDQGAENDSCSLVLYYLIDGSDNSKLSISYQNMSSDVKTKVLEREGQWGQTWVREKVHLPPKTKQVIIEAMAGGHSDPALALDDLILSPGCRIAQGRLVAKVKTETQGPPTDQTRSRSGVRETCKFATGVMGFETDAEGWKDLSVGRLKWLKSNGSLPDTASRNYLAVQRAEGKFLSGAVTHSPTLCAVGPSCVINMTYYFNSGPAGYLSLRLLDPVLGTHTHAWQSQGESGTAWRTAVIPVGERMQPFQLVLAGSVEPLPGGSWGTAVDEIQFVGCGTDEPSQTGPVTCNFETGLCAWYQDQTEEIDWVLGTSSDHTTGTGKFLYVEGGSRRDRGMRARIITYPQHFEAQPQCLSFYYRIRGPDAGTLNLYSKHDAKESLLWTGTGTHGNRWHRESITLTYPVNSKYQLVFDAVRDGAIGHIAVDDITLRSGSCPTPNQCSFEAGPCGFISMDSSTWKLHQNMQLNGQAGPLQDHTLQSITGHFMLVDTSAGALPREKSTVLSTGLYSAQPDKGCLSFWYQLGGNQAGTLNVDVQEGSGKKKEKRRLLSISETSRGNWHYKSVTFQTGTTWTLIFEAVGAGGEQSFIALDDFHISYKPCHEEASCNFESSSCAWTNVRIPLLDTYDWDWTSGAEQTGQRSAPKKDHSLGTAEGHYMFVDTGVLHAEGSSAWLISEHLPATTGSCFTFWYRADSMEHYHLGELVLFVSSAQGLLPIWALHGYHSNDWQQEQLQLNSSTEFQIVFEASKGSRAHSATVALDDLIYTSGTPCNIQKHEKVVQKDHSGIILTVLVGVVLVVLCAAAAYLMYRKRKRNHEGASSVSSHNGGLEGFDNVVFEASADDTLPSI